MGYTTTATAAGTTTLTISSNYRQFFTGSTTQTIVLPVTSTLVTGIAYEIENNSTGTLTVNSSGGNLIGTIPAGVCAHAVCIGTTLTTAADWDWDYISTTTITGTGANVLGTSPTITSPTLVTPALGTPASGVMTNVTGINYDGYKNRIINGAMVIDQRNAGASVTPTDGQYLVDRWDARLSQASKYTVQQNAGSVTPPAGFANYLGATSSSAYSVTSGDYFFLEQKIEGYNMADFDWGTANAKSVTLSFWVRSSLTGTFGGSLVSYSSTYSYPFSYTISSANTWEQKSITIVGPTAGTWTTNNTGSLVVAFSLGMGSTRSGTAGSWSGVSNYYSVTGATSVVGTNGATFYITGVQLEKGSTATSFDYRPYGTELALCQRYLPAFTTLSGGDGGAIGMGVYYDTTHTASYIPFSVITRVAPTGVTVTNASSFASDGVNSASVTAFALSSTSQYGAGVNVTVGSAQTAGQSARLRFNGTGAQLLFTGCEL
jgi:hypothetical protein